MDILHKHFVFRIDHGLRLSRRKSFRSEINHEKINLTSIRPNPERLDRIALACAFGAFGDFLSKDGRAEAPNCQIGKSGWLFTERPDPIGRR
jgi:hypothetical protein